MLYRELTQSFSSVLLPSSALRSACATLPTNRQRLLSSHPFVPVRLSPRTRLRSPKVISVVRSRRLSVFSLRGPRAITARHSYSVIYDYLYPTSVTMANATEVMSLNSDLRLIKHRNPFLVVVLDGFHLGVSTSTRAKHGCTWFGEGR